MHLMLAALPPMLTSLMHTTAKAANLGTMQMLDIYKQQTVSSHSILHVMAIMLHAMQWQKVCLL